VNRALIKLFLNNNRIESISEEIHNLQSLGWLSIGHNKLKNVDTINQLPNLRGETLHVFLVFPIFFKISITSLKDLTFHTMKLKMNLIFVHNQEFSVFSNCTFFNTKSMMFAFKNFLFSFLFFSFLFFSFLFFSFLFFSFFSLPL